MERQPSSPGSSPVELGDCLEELLQFTLQSHIDGTLEHDLGLHTDFCSHLLNHNLPPPNLDRTDVSRLYKDLVSSLRKSVSKPSCGSLDDLEDKEECNELIAQGGAELVNVLKTVNFELHVHEPFFTQLRDGLKRVEGRCAAGDYNRIQPGALILFNKCLLFEVQDVRQYPSFSAMLKAESLDKVLPGIKTLADGIQIYRKFYSEEKEVSNGVLGIHVKKSVAQPYVVLSRIISVSFLASLLFLTYVFVAKAKVTAQKTGTVLFKGLGNANGLRFLFDFFVSCSQLFKP
ncbi:uncharacterized protein LOC120071108 isoform X2 [Benincasa hispida]|uniref:uncharacterized protein LOC120071108 isoform X2 n=1 Tax=Benincasa hispida TaxID=102211 RepID=UPI001902310E|nr:uncharacterized protein LOC120071108 isoform X2 [Benincasa hispida]